MDETDSERVGQLRRRFSQRQEALDHGPRLNILRVISVHYHTERCHQGLGNSLIEPLEFQPGVNGKIETTERLGGLLRSYRRAA